MEGVRRFIIKMATKTILDEIFTDLGINQKPETPLPRETYVFVYGSLLSPPSVATSLGRMPKISEYIPVALEHYSKSFSAYGFLNVTKEPVADKKHTFGALLRLNTYGELYALDRRELCYRRVDVTKLINTLDDEVDLKDAIIYTYIKKSKTNYNIARDDYKELCATAAHIFGQAFYNAWLEDLKNEYGYIRISAEEN